MQFSGLRRRSRKPVKKDPDIIKGIVTVVKPQLSYFEVMSEKDGTNKIYSSVGVLPMEGEQVTIYFPQKLRNFYLILPITKCVYSQIRLCDREASLWGIFDNYSTAYLCKEYQIVDKLINQLKGFLPNLDDLIHCIRFLYLCYDNNNNSLYITAPHELNVAFKNSKPYQSLVNFSAPSYTKGLIVQQYRSCLPLVGIMNIGKKHNSMILEGGNVWVFVKFIGGPADPYHYTSTLVIVKKYTLVAEIYEDQERPTLFYILVNETNIVVVQHFVLSLANYYPVYEEYKGLKEVTYELVVSKKAQTIVGYNWTFQCWMEVNINNKREGSWMVCYLIFPQELCKIASLLQENKGYLLHTDAPLRKDRIAFFKELRLQGKPQQPVCLLDKNSVFQAVSDDGSGGGVVLPRRHVTTYRDLVDRMRDRSGDTFDLTLRIDRRDVAPNTMELWCPRRHRREPYFGTGSNFQEKLTFKDPGTLPVDLYLRNQENQTCHVGLLPGATVKITNVLSQKGRYLCSTIFTTVEVIEYERPRFCASDINFEDFDRWTSWNVEQFRNGGPYLHNFFKIPCNTFLYGWVFFRAVSGFRLENGPENFKMT